MGTGCFPGVKRPGRGGDHPPPPSAEVENEQSYTSTPPQGPGWLVIGRTLLCYSMEQSPSGEANQSLQLVKKFPAFLWNPKVLYRTHTCPPPVPIVSQLQLYLLIIISMGNSGPKLAQNCPHHHQGIRLPWSRLRRDNCIEENVLNGLTRRHCFTAELQMAQSTSGGTNPERSPRAVLCMSAYRCVVIP
jgi:hypothetical protein